MNKMKQKILNVFDASPKWRHGKWRRAGQKRSSIFWTIKLKIKSGFNLYNDRDWSEIMIFMIIWWWYYDIMIFTILWYISCDPLEITKHDKRWNRMQKLSYIFHDVFDVLQETRLNASEAIQNIRLLKSLLSIPFATIFLGEV